MRQLSIGDIADNLKKAGWSWGCGSAIDCNGGHWGHWGLGSLLGSTGVKSKHLTLWPSTLWQQANRDWIGFDESVALQRRSPIRRKVRQSLAAIYSIVQSL